MTLSAYAKLLCEEAASGLPGPVAQTKEERQAVAALEGAALDLLRLGIAPTAAELEDRTMRGAWIAAAHRLDEERARRVAAALTGQRLDADQQRASLLAAVAP